VGIHHPVSCALPSCIVRVLSLSTNTPKFVSPLRVEFWLKTYSGALDLFRTVFAKISEEKCFDSEHELIFMRDIQMTDLEFVIFI